MSVALNRLVVLRDDGDGTVCGVAWDEESKQFLVTAENPFKQVVLNVSTADLLAFADLILKTYAENDPF